MFNNIKLSLLIIGLFTIAGLYAQNRPFPMALDYPGVIKPNNVTQTTMNSDVEVVYNDYKRSYVQESNISGDFYVKSGGTGASGTLITISEAHGYGMMVFALMAGADDSAKIYFDGMYDFYKRFPAKEDGNFMSWEILVGESGGQNSATDGDMDIAYALLLAHDQWGSTGSINYLSEAKRVIGALKTSIISPSTYRIKLGDWAVDSWNVNNKYNTRSSDWMTGHLRAYKKATGDSFWDNVANEVYQCVTEITTSYSSNTGLMPDFVTGATAVPDPNSGGTGEWNGDKFYYNACRYPWRISMDYYHYNTTNSKSAAVKLVDWASTKTNGNPANFYPGYSLSGSALSTSYKDAAFTGPLVVASTVDSKYQTFLNNGWTTLKNWSYDDGVYGDAIKLLSMLVISGNWWAPGEQLPGTGTQFTITASAGSGGSISPSGAVKVDSASAKIFNISVNSGYKVSDVKVNGSSVGAVTSYTFSSVSSDQTIAATFSPIQYAISASAGTGGSISPSGNVNVNYGSTQSFSISANSGYQIDSVIVDGTNKGQISSWSFNNVTAPHTIRAVFRQLFTISASAQAGGTITPSGDATLAKGESQSYLISANTGYNIDDVKVDGISKGAITSYDFTNVTSDHSIVATFKVVPAYTITASAEIGATISPTGTVVVTEGDSKTFTISSSMGYAIDNVNVDGTDLGVISEYTFTNVTTNHTIVVTTRIVPTYNIVASAGTGGAISPSGTITVSESMDETFTITAANGYKIKSVVVDDSLNQGAISNYTFENVSADHKIDATFELKSYTLTASVGSNGSILPSGATIVNHGESQTYTFTPNSGYVVDSVKVDGKYVGSSTTYTIANVSGDHNISVTFKMPVYEITATAGSNGSISPSGTVTLSKGESQVYKITADNGYKIDSIFVDDIYAGNDSVFTFTNVVESHTVHVTFKFKVPTVYIKNTHGGFLELDSGDTIFAYGEIEVSNPKKPQGFHFLASSGYVIDSIVVDGNNVGGNGGSEYWHSQKVRADVYIEGFFSPTGTSHTITISSGVGGTVNPSGAIKVSEGDNVTIDITPNFGYVIEDVTVNSSSQGAISSYTFTNVTSNGTLNATFKTVEKHTISATASAGGAISPMGDISVDDGVDKTFMITPESGWLIDQVFIDGVDSGAISSYTFKSVSGNHTIQAIFKEVPKHTISAVAGVGGAISPSGNVQVTDGNNQSFEITVEDGYIIDSVIVDNTNKGNITSYEFSGVTTDHSIKVVFKEIPKFIITATAGTGGSISPIGNVEVLEGKNQSFSITALLGYKVDAVLIDGSDLGAITDYTFTSVNGTHTIEAKFVEDGTPIGPVSKTKNSPFTVLLSENPISLRGANNPDLVISGKGAEVISEVELILFDAVGNELYRDEVYKYGRSDVMVISIDIKKALVKGSGAYLLFLKIEDNNGMKHLYKLMLGVGD